MSSSDRNPYETWLLVNAESAKSVGAALPELFDEMVTLTAPWHSSVHKTEIPGQPFTFEYSDPNGETYGQPNIGLEAHEAFRFTASYQYTKERTVTLTITREVVMKEA